MDTLTVFPKTWTKGHWPLDDLWPHICWGHMCDSTQGSLCPSPMGIYVCGYSDQFCKLPHTYTYIVLHTYMHTYILHTTYRMSDHIVSYWTQFRRDKKRWLHKTIKLQEVSLTSVNCKILKHILQFNIMSHLDNRDFAFFVFERTKHQPRRNLRSYLVLQRLCNQAALSPGIDAFWY